MGRKVSMLHGLRITRYSQEEGYVVGRIESQDYEKGFVHYGASIWAQGYSVYGIRASLYPKILLYFNNLKE